MVKYLPIVLVHVAAAIFICCICSHRRRCYCFGYLFTNSVNNNRIAAILVLSGKQDHNSTRFSSSHIEPSTKPSTSPSSQQDRPTLWRGGKIDAQLSGPGRRKLIITGRVSGIWSSTIPLDCYDGNLFIGIAWFHILKTNAR